MQTSWNHGKDVFPLFMPKSCYLVCQTLFLQNQKASDQAQESQTTLTSHHSANPAPLTINNNNNNNNNNNVIKNIEIQVLFT